MKCLLSVSLATLVVAANFFLTGPAQAPELRPGVTVQMATTTHAAAYAAADNADAWIVAVTSDRKLYFGTKAVTPEELMDEMKVTSRHRDAKLYLKADARATFADLKGALGPARSAHFEDIVLLTSQPGSSAPGRIAPPEGIEVAIGIEKTGESIPVHLSGPAEGAALTVNGKPVTWPELESTLKGLVHGQAQVRIETNDAVPFANIVRVIDGARAAGATVALPVYQSI
jgi:biopolymer transport protein ExbD